MRAFHSPGSNTRIRNTSTGLTAARRFAQDEGGAVTALSLFIFVLFLAMGGIAIDVMHQEMERARLQSTLDSAVLAGAGAPEGMQPRAVVEDYFKKAGMAQYLDAEKDGDIVTTLTSSKVSASASMKLDTYLMKLSGVDTLTAAGASTAEKRIPKLEVILVLDVSGSMGQNHKIDNLRTAAKRFVATILDSSTPGDTSISIVPFSWSVTPTQTMFDAFAVDVKHPYSTCLQFKDNDYTHATLTSGSSSYSSGIPVDQMIYTSIYGSFDNLNSSWRSCYTDAYMQIMPYSDNKAALQAKIDTLQPDGNTSGDQGINWGAALLDPSFRQVSAKLIDAGEMNSDLSNVPTDYGTSDTLKVIVMMGDGANTESYQFNTNSYNIGDGSSAVKYRGANSDLYKVTYTDQTLDYAFNKYRPDRKYYGSYYDYLCSYKRYECVYKADGTVKSTYYLYSHRYGEYYSIDQNNWISSSAFNDLPTTMAGFISSDRLSWEMAWGLMSPDYYYQVTGDPGAWNDYVGSETITGSMKDTRMQNACTATKSEGVVVYTIGFEVPQGGNAENQLRNCASSPANYYRAEGISITDAFSSIAGNVQNLRLTQ